MFKRLSGKTVNKTSILSKKGISGARVYVVKDGAKIKGFPRLFFFGREAQNKRTWRHPIDPGTTSEIYCSNAAYNLLVKIFTEAELPIVWAAIRAHERREIKSGTHQQAMKSQRGVRSYEAIRVK